MKNNLFNQALLKKYADKKVFDLKIKKYDFLKVHAEKVENNDFSSEVSSYLYFYDFLKEVLGYDRENNILFNEPEDIGRGVSEFALKYGDKKFMIIELKDQNTDLDKPQNRVNDKRTPVDQAFDYAQHSDINNPIDWILVSNFKEFRLYNYNKRSGKCICFSYDELLDKEKFKYFMVSFSSKSHTKNFYPEKLLKETIIIEKQLENNFYKLFHETRLMLIKELEEFNNFNRIGAVHYAQLILNRFMFISFAEDTGLLDGQITTDTIVTPIKKGNLKHNSIFQRLNELFLDINEGNKYKEIPAYNGGLFEENLEFIKIRDTVDDQEIFKELWQNYNFDLYEKDIKHLLEPYENEINPIYKNFLTISSFDFSSELDVNILGHIFENSIGDLEELKADVKGRRKKEGIFYTPDYITDYICRNTIIPYLSKSGEIDNINDLLKEYSWSRDIDDLDSKLKKIKIVDPACGSGAFLNKATDILLDIHEAIFNIKKGYTTSSQMRVGKGKRRRTEEIIHTDLGAYVFDPIEKRREILLNNIYGVDINQESVDITKLSLFLKVCRSNLKLPNLNKNIKCGNSIIEDVNIVDNAFDWELGFKKIFEDGKFDIVLGNPPYVFTRGKNFSKTEKEYFSKKYGKSNNNPNEKSRKSQSGKLNLFTLFLEKSIDLIKPGGKIGFIVPNNLLRTTTYDMTRVDILNSSKISQIIDLSSGVFDKVTAATIIILLDKEENEDIRENNEVKIVTDILDLKNGIYTYYNINQSSFSKNPSFAFNIYVTNELFDIFQKMRDISYDLHKFTKNIIEGIVTPKGKDRFISYSKKSKLWKKYLEGKDIKRYYIDYKGKYILYDREKLHRPRSEEIFKASEKILIQRISGGKRVITAAYDNKQYYTFASINNLLLEDDSPIDIKFLLTLLNSTLINAYYNLNFSNKSDLTVNISSTYLEKLPIYLAKKEQQEPFIEKAELMLRLYNKLQSELNEFHDWLKYTFNIEKLSKKLENYYLLDQEEFFEEISKKKVNIKIRKNYQLLKDEFNNSFEKVSPLIEEINDIDDEIDQMVYNLYGLTKAEIEIIKKSIE